jgi:hypothetical protein
MTTCKTDRLVWRPKHKAGSKHWNKRVLRNVLWLSDFAEMWTRLVKISFGSNPTPVREFAQSRGNTFKCRQRYGHPGWHLHWLPSWVAWYSGEGISKILKHVNCVLTQRHHVTEKSTPLVVIPAKSWHANSETFGHFCPHIKLYFSTWRDAHNEHPYSSRELREKPVSQWLTPAYNFLLF